MKVIRIAVHIIFVIAVIALVTQAYWVPEVTRYLVGPSSAEIVPSPTPRETTTTHAVIPSAVPVATQPGTLSGTITIGPVCPVEQQGHPCAPTPEMYAAHPVSVYTSTHTLVETLTPDASGRFRTALPAGTYIVDVAHQAVGAVRGAPQTVVIRTGGTLSVSIDIDTGIR